MVNFGYPYNDIVICKDSTDYLLVHRELALINYLALKELRSIIAADIFTCDGCAREPYFYVPAETQSYVIKLSCSRKVLAASGD